ncbi:glycosyltransferase [Legionella gresilensis]|uniref:glycosyltransferase n=1 Tax=Legionella gresilensis TaxID=91823 RepID=UPI001040F181|nr:glycosyltransferase [Legionella gresilensis]
MKHRCEPKAHYAVLMAVYNGIKYLPKQIETILLQKDVRITLFISVDVSEDGSERWVDDLSSSDPRVIILPHGQKFGCAAKNFFRLIQDVDFSQFDYIAFADQDDEWYLDKLSRAATLLGTSSFKVYSSNVIAFWPNGKKKLVNKAQPQKKWDFIFESAGPGCTYVMTQQFALAFKKHLLNIDDLSQQISFHDWYCYAFARAHHFKWFIDARPSMLYRQHVNNEMGVNAGLKAYYYRYKQIKNGWWLMQARTIANLVGLSESNFIKSWANRGRKGLIILALYAFQCRRKNLDKITFTLICLLLAFKGNYNKKATITLQRETL